MKKINAAVVGCGVISGVYLTSFQNVFSPVNVVSCSDQDERKMKSTAEKFGLKAETYEHILNDREIGMIINLTSPKAHFSVTKQALEHGKHVYSEKLIAASYDEGKILCCLAEQNKLRLGAAPDTFLGGSVQTVKYMADKGYIGKISSGVVSLSRDYKVFGENLPHLFQKESSILADMGCYYLTALCAVLGPAKRVFAFGRKNEETHKVTRVTSPFFGEEITVGAEHIITAVLEFENGALVTMHFNGSSSYNETFRLELYGEKGIIYMGNPNLFGGDVYISKPGNTALKVPFTHGFLKEARGLGAAEMAWSILSGRPHRAAKETALHILEIIEKTEKSCKTGKAEYMESRMRVPKPLPEGYIGSGYWEPDEESALI